MKTTKITITICLLFVFMLINGNQVFSQDDLLPELEGTDASLEDEMAWLQAETFVITASRVLENIKKTAASITVITEQQIRQMGARNLMDVLKIVPGISYRYDTDGNYKVAVRGLAKSAGQNILLMINSHPLNQNYSGGAILTYAPLNIDNIQRIEVIRGPGSALYGANAFAGVINIITKDAGDIDGVQVSARGGSFQTQQYNVLLGKAFHDIDIAFNVNYFDTDGFEREIKQDSLTLIDRQFGTNASRAPGHTTEHDQRYNTSLTLGYKGLKFDGSYTHIEHDWPVSPVYALGGENNVEDDEYYLTLGYDRTIKEGLDFSGKIYRNHFSTNTYFQGYPPGTLVMTPTGPAILLNGAIAKPAHKENRTGIEIMTTYKPVDSNTIVAGLTYEKMDQYDVEYAANFLYTPIQNVINPLPGVQDITDIQNYNKDVDRTFKAGFLEDIWDLRDNLRLTVGARYDDYSDFDSGSFNPRAGLVWEFIAGYDVKLLYGRAFRAPSFYELYSQNNPAFIGNPDLDPEIVDTYEISVGAEVSEAISGRITGFRNAIKDSVDIDVVEGQRIFRNKDEIRSQGVEVEVRYNFGKGTYLAGTYVYQDVENLDTEERPWNTVEHKGNIIANIRLSKYFNFYTGVYLQGGYEREPGDTREDNDGFVTVNTTLIARKFIEGLELRGSVYNLLGADYSFPTPVNTLPEDFPMPGRTFMVELQYEF